jgi:lysophospholipase L1-like esterase
LLRNVAGGNYSSELSYYIPVTVVLVVSLYLVYSLAFRLQDAALFQLNISFAIFGSFLLALEFGVRVWDRFDPIFRPVDLEDTIVYKKSDSSFSPYQPGSVGMTHGHPVRFNAWGFRGPEWPAAKPHGNFRIMVLGDSFTFGQGVGEDELYTTLLEKQLRGKFSGKTIEVLNLGVMGYSAVDEAKLLKKIGPLLQPDLLLVQFTGNDVREGNQVPEKERNRWGFPIPEGFKTVLLTNSKLMNWMTIKYDQILMNWELRPNVVTSLESAYEPTSDEWKIFVEAYREMLQWTKANQMPPPLVGLFLSTQYSKAELNNFIDMTPAIRMQDRYAKQVGATLSQIGIPTVDYLPLFRNYNKQNMAVSKWEGHPNALAHRLYAEGFLDAITSRNLVH